MFNPDFGRMQTEDGDIKVPESAPAQELLVAPVRAAYSSTPKDTWDMLGSRAYENPSDLYQVKKPSSVEVGVDGQYDYKPKVGIANAFLKGLPSDQSVTNPYPYDPTYQATFGEKFASGLSSFVRNGVEAGMDLFDPQMKEARASVDRLRKFDPQAADDIESQALGGARLSNTELTVKLSASVGEAALSVLPFFKVGRAAAVAAEAATLSKMGKAGKVISSSPLLSKLYGSGASGALYGGLYGLHEYDADWKQGVLNASMGGVFGVGLTGVSHALAFAGKYTGTKVLEGVGAVATAAKNKLAESMPAKWYSGVFSVNSTLKQYYGDIGKNFVNMFRGASREATQDLGRVQLSLIENGLIEPPAGMKRHFVDTQYVGGDKELMATYNQVLRGQGAFADPLLRTQTIQSDARLQFLDGLRKTYGAMARDSGVVKEMLDMDTYLPKHTPVVELSRSNRSALLKAGTEAEREAILASNDPMVREMVENSVIYEKKFKTLSEAYESYYDYADLVSGGSHTPMGNNRFLQEMVSSGKAKTIEEARGKVIADLKRQKQSLTPLATSLDFKREIDLPWYDPNPARVMPQYTLDASMRISMASKFGANDEVLHEMIGGIKADLDRGVKADEAAKTFEDFVRVVTGQVERSPSVEKASAFIRALQVPKLAFAQIVNLGQSLNTLMASDLGATMHGLTAAFTAKGSREAIERGVLLNSFMRQVSNYNSGGSKVAEGILKYSGFTYTEMFNRVAGSNAADRWVESNVKTILAGKDNKNLSKLALQELGLDVDDIVSRGGKLSQEEKAIASQIFVEKTQFLGQPIDLPYFASSPTGKVFFQFKTFAYQQARFITEEFKTNFRRGEVKRGFRNLLILGTIFPMTGEVLSDVRSLITQEKRPTKAFDRYVADIFAAGTYGMLYDFYRSAESGNTAKMLAGATVGDAIDYLENTVKTIKNPSAGLKAFSKKILQQTGVGRIGVNAFYPSTKQGKSSLQSIIDWAADE